MSIPGPVVLTESPERIPVLARIGGMNIPRLPPPREQRSQRRHYSLPADGISTPAPPASKKLKGTKKSEKAMSNLHPSDAVHGKNEQHALSHVQEANQLTAGGDENASPPVGADERVPVASTTSATADDNERHSNADMGVAQGKCIGSPVFKSHPSTASVDTRGEIWNAPRKDPSKLQRAKTTTASTIRSIKTAIDRYRRRNSKAKDPTASASAPQLCVSVPSLVHDQPRHSEIVQPQKKYVSTAVVYAADSQLKSADVEDAEQTATEPEEIEKLRQDLSHSHSQIAELQKRCEAQSRDLESSNNFFNTADKSSDSDVIQAVQRLNAEVQQNTTYMADCLAECFEFTNVTTDPTSEQILAVQRASNYIGLVLAKSLETKSPEDIPMLLQTAFQAYLASVLCETASSWAFEQGQNAFMNGIYQRLRRVGEEPDAYIVPLFLLTNRKNNGSIEAQAISGRWRALTRVHIVQNWVTHPESLVNVIIVGISDILLAAGCTTPQSDIISKVTSKFEEKIALLVDLAGRLNRMFDDVISSDFEVLVVRPSEKFDDKKMEDADGCPAGIEGASVLCTTHLGLMKRIPVGTLWERGKKQKMIVLKAKVLLESFLNTED